jgi:hypothetical protein
VEYPAALANLRALRVLNVMQNRIPALPGEILVRPPPRVTRTCDCGNDWVEAVCVVVDDALRASYLRRV